MKYTLLIALTTLSFSSIAAVFKTVQRDQLFKNTNCQTHKDCQLSEFRLYVEDAKVVSSSFGTNHSTSAFISYKTNHSSQLDQFAIVQFIRGCQFDSNADGTILYRYSREFFGEIVPFVHRDWVIDSVDIDPMYNSDDRPGMPRHALYRWNEVDGSFEKNTENFFYAAEPLNPLLYVKDRPGSAFYTEEDGDAKNISLEFKSCIFRTEDVPLISTPTGMNWQKAIHCFDWYSSYLYNHQTHQFTSQQQVSPVCLK